MTDEEKAREWLDIYAHDVCSAVGTSDVISLAALFRAEREHERARIVAWLRQRAAKAMVMAPGSSNRDAAEWMSVAVTVQADAIERGEID